MRMHAARQLRVNCQGLPIRGFGFVVLLQSLENASEVADNYARLRVRGAAGFLLDLDPFAEQRFGLVVPALLVEREGKAVEGGGDVRMGVAQQFSLQGQDFAK